MITTETMYQDVFGGFSPDYPMIEFYEGDKKQLVYAQDFDRKTKAIAAFLEEGLKDIAPGRWVGLKYPTHPCWMNVFYALEMIGYKVMLLDETATSVYLENAVKLGNLAAIVGVRGETYPVKAVAFEEAIIADKGMPGRVAWESMMCLCTSGTTGNAKSVVFKAETLSRIHRVLRSTLLAHPYTIKSSYELPINQMRVMATLPMRHIFGFQVPSIYIGYGCTLVFPKNPGVLELIRTIRDEKIWMTYGVPALWKSIFNVYRNQADGLDKTSFHDFFGRQFTHGLIGGASIDEELRALIAKIDFDMANTYGCTETGGAITLGFLNEEKSISGSAGYSGQLFNGHKAGVLEEDGTWQPQGIGELAVKGLNITDGSLDRGIFVPRTDSLEELYRVGDIFKIENGDYYYLGRADNMILTDAGENIYVEELEEDFALLREKADQYCAVGYQGAPVLVVSKPACTEEDLIGEIARANTALPHYKRLEWVFVIDDTLPLTSKKEIDRMRIAMRLKDDVDAFKSVTRYSMRKSGAKG